MRILDSSTSRSLTESWNYLIIDNENVLTIPTHRDRGLLEQT